MKYKFSLIDIWDKINFEKEGNIWCDLNNNLKSRIDYIFFIEDLCYFIEKIFFRKFLDVLIFRMSDYMVFIFYCIVLINKRGSGYWKMNMLILYDINFCNIINNFFD